MIDLTTARFKFNGKLYQSLDELVKNLSDEDLFSFGDFIYGNMVYQKEQKNSKSQKAKNFFKGVGSGFLIFTGASLITFAPLFDGMLKSLTVCAIGLASTVNGLSLLDKKDETKEDEVDFEFIFHKLEVEVLERYVGSTIFPEFYESFIKEYNIQEEIINQGDEPEEDEDEKEIQFTILY